MIIRSVQHRGLLRLLEDDNSRALRTDLVKRLRNILAALIAAPDMDAVRGPPGWKIHQLKGARAGTCSISVSGNWRITFDIKKEKSAISTWRIITDEHQTKNNRDDAPASRRIHPR